MSGARLNRRLLGIAAFVALIAACESVTDPDHQYAPPSVQVTGASITHTLLTAGNNAVNQKVYTTAAIAPAPNTLITVAVMGHRAYGATPSPTLSGGGMTAWTQVATTTFDSVATPLKRLTIYRAMSAAPGSGPITITFGGNVAHCQWIVSQWDGVETSGVNGAGAIGQTGSSRGDAVSGLSVPLAAFGNPNNVAYGVFGVRSRVPAVTPGAGFTEIAEQPSAEWVPSDLESEWAFNVNTIRASWTKQPGGALGVEIKAAAAPPPAGSSDRIVFTSTRDGNAEIYVMNANGTGVTRLTNEPGLDVQPTWSPDGKEIAFTRHGPDSDIFVMNADGSRVTQLTDNAVHADDEPAWSPDGKKIAFTSSRDGDFEIYVMNADGTGVTQLTNNALSGDNEPAWSPDGTRIAFTSDRDGDLEIYVMNADGTGVRQLTNNAFVNNLAVHDHEPAWSPDGTQIVFSSTRDQPYDHIFVMKADGTGVTQLTSNAGFNDRRAAWSPDGRQIAFDSDRGGHFPIFEIYVMNADGTGVTQLTTNGIQLAWTRQ